MTCDASIRERLLRRFRQIYGSGAADVLPHLLPVVERNEDLPHSPRPSRWDQSDVVLITYADQVHQQGCTALASLRHFFLDYQLTDVISTIHLLPFYPSTSDDGFSVVDYRAVDPTLGDWDDIERLAEHVDLAFDLVLNHVSRHSQWFQHYVRGESPYDGYFIAVEPATDLSAVTRPRSLPLLTPVETAGGERHVWSTFSPDQIDLNYANPAVLLELVDLLLFYVRRRARFVRFDAVAYLWKEIGTRCIHLPQTHAIVKLTRDVLDMLAPAVVLLTETNVPHAENISYFGEGDEAHLVYQFSLPPLLADALLQHDASVFRHWLSEVSVTRRGTTFFNFTASHDGIGVRPLEGLLPEERRNLLVQAAVRRQGLVSTRRNSDGTDSPYELNITYLDLLADEEAVASPKQRLRFLSSQAIMLALRGIPGIYFNSLVGTGNDLEAARASGLARRINRHKFQRDEIDQALANRDSLPCQIFTHYRHMLSVRVAQPAFHPEAAQQVLPVRHPALLAFVRTSLDAQQQIVVLANLSDQPLPIDFGQWPNLSVNVDLLTGHKPRADQYTLTPYQVAWLDVTVT